MSEIGKATPDYERIWLEPRTEASEANGRQWCVDKVWPEEWGDPEPTEYLRADIASAWKTEAETLLLATHLGTHAVEALTAERDAAKQYATTLLLALAAKHYPEWKPAPLDDLLGVLTQIDNLTSGMEREACS